MGTNGRTIPWGSFQVYVVLPKRARGPDSGRGVPQNPGDDDDASALKRIALALETHAFSRRHEGHMPWRDRLDVDELQEDQILGLTREELVKRCIMHQHSKIAARESEKDQVLD